MPNIATVMRDEITRLSRREHRKASESIKKAAAQHRRAIAALRSEVARLTRQVALLTRNAARQQHAVTISGNGSSGPKLRFVAKGLRSQRERLGLSQPDFGRLFGVSAQTIYNWEHEVSRPRDEQIAKIAAVRTMGKREVSKRLEQLDRG